MLYKIVRNYFCKPGKGRVIKRGLTLAEAQAHCQDPETSSQTCRSAKAKQRTHHMGPWFDGYDKDR